MDSNIPHDLQLVELEAMAAQLRKQIELAEKTIQLSRTHLATVESHIKKSRDKGHDLAGE